MSLYGRRAIGQLSCLALGGHAPAPSLSNSSMRVDATSWSVWKGLRSWILAEFGLSVTSTGSLYWQCIKDPGSVTRVWKMERRRRPNLCAASERGLTRSLTVWRGFLADRNPEQQTTAPRREKRIFTLNQVSNRAIMVERPRLGCWIERSERGSFVKTLSFAFRVLGQAGHLCSVSRKTVYYSRVLYDWNPRRCWTFRCMDVACSGELVEKVSQVSQPWSHHDMIV